MIILDFVRAGSSAWLERSADNRKVESSNLSRPTFLNSTLSLHCKRFFSGSLRFLKILSSLPSQTYSKPASTSLQASSIVDGWLIGRLRCGDFSVFCAPQQMSTALRRVLVDRSTACQDLLEATNYSYEMTAEILGWESIDTMKKYYGRMGEQKIQKGMLQAMGIEIQWKKRILRGISTLGRVQISPGPLWKSMVRLGKT